VISRHASRYQRGGQKPDIEEQTIQWSRDKREKRTNNDLQNTPQKNKD